MGLGDSIGGFYTQLEDGFYSTMDFLADKGVPVYAAIDPLEGRGIPALPVFIVLLLGIAFLGYGFFFLQGQGTNVLVSITDDTGAPLKSVSVSFADEKTGEKLNVGSDMVSDGSTITIPRTLGASIRVSASKNGYEDLTKAFDLKKNNDTLALSLGRKITRIEGKIKLIDSETGDPIEGAVVVAKFSDKASEECIAGENGMYTCPQVVEGKDTAITVTHPNYEQKNLTAKFLSESESQLELAAKAGAAAGKSNLIVRAFDKQTQERLAGFTVRVFDSKANELLTEKKLGDNENEFVEKIQKGTSIRVVVEKQDYINYDSGSSGENETLRSDEAIKEAYLRKGSNAITVTVLDPTGRPMSQVPVILSNTKGEVIKQINTNLAGEALFESLDPLSEYFVSAWQDKFVPAIKKVNLKEKNKESLVMERGTASNSGSLTIFTTDDKSKPIAGVSLKFLVEDSNGSLAPIGIPNQKTDITGKFEVLAPLNSNVVVKASKDKLAGEAKVRVLETFKNEALIQMKEPYSEVTVRVLDSKGEEVKGGIITITAGKDVLYENKYEEDGITVSPKGAKYLSVMYTNDSGEVIDEEVFVQGMDKVDVKKGGSKGVGTTPNIEYLGVYTVDGTQASGITKGVDYFLKFRAVFPEGKNKSGFHARLGDDTVNFVDSEDAGIVGFSANGASSYYGRSYSPKPNPGFEALDFENSGSEGGYNKWLELYFQSGGEKIIKVRVKAKETATTKETAVSYRAWSEIGGKIYRNPADDELGLEVYSQSKTSLYAATSQAKVKILEASASCKNDLCASYKFVRSDGSEFNTGNFKGSLGSLYALEITLSPDKAKSVTVKASTQKQKPKVFFQGFGINEEGQFPDLNLTDTSLQVENVPASENEQVKVKVYFKAVETGSSYVSLQLVSGQETINEQFYFDVFRERPILVRTNPENVVFGEDFIILLEDETQHPVENAQIMLSAISGEPLGTIVGNGSTNVGLNGRYIVKNTFESGSVKYSISADGFKTIDGTIPISKQGLMEFGQNEAYFQIQKGSQAADVQVQLSNKSRQDIREITFEVKPTGSMPEGLTIKPVPVAGIPKNSSQKVLITAEYTGDKESSHGEATIIARGVAEGGYTVTAQIRAVVDFNPKIAQDCLEFSKQKIVVYLASGMEDRPYYNNYYNSQYGNSGSAYGGNYNSYSPYQNNNYANSYTGSYNTGYGSNVEDVYSSNYYNPNIASSYYRYNNYTTSASDSFTAKLANRPQCQVEMQLKPEVVGESKRAEGITIESKEIRLSPQLTDTQGRRSDNDEITVSATNKILRNYAGKERFTFDIVYKMDGFEKSIPVEVYIWNPRFALMVTRNIELFLGPDQQGRYSAQVPLFVRNVGEADIENVDFRVSSTSSRGNVNLSILPPYTVQFLRKGDSIEPPKLLVAQVLRNDKTTLVEQKELDITGVIDGQTFSFGPVIVTAHVSADQCLVAVPGNVAFFSAKYDTGTLMKPVTLRNTCAEEVSIVEITKPLIGNNYLYMAPANLVIPPGAEAQVNLQLDRKGPFDGSPQPIYFLGFLPRSGSPIQSTPVVVDIKLGNIAKKGEAATEIQELDVCEGAEFKEKKPVRFPIIATGNAPQCDVAYCDAVQLSNYIADRIEQKIMDAEKQINTKSSEVGKTNCAQVELAGGYCTFSGLGVKTEQFTVYMSHDSMTPAMLSKALESRKGSARNFLAKPFEGKDIGPYIGGFSRQVWMNGAFRGCGRYTITIDGAVAAQGSRIVPELMNVIIDMQPEEGTDPRQATEQCVPKAQNVMNFLPRDEGLTKAAAYDTWLGVVNSRDAALDELSKEIAKSLFGSDQRSTQSEASTNNLKLDLTNESDYLVKIRMNPSSPNNPVTTDALVKESVGGDDKLQKEIVKEAGQAIKNLRENVIEGCIGRDESYIMLKSSKLGMIEAKASKFIAVQYKAPSCTDFNVTSDVREKVSLSARRATQYDGIEGEPYFLAMEKDGTRGTAPITEVEATKLDPKTGKYVGEGFVCVTGNGQLSQVNGKKIVAGAKKVDGQGKKPKEVEIELKVCGIHPLDFMEKIRDKKAGQEDYYATFVWKGGENDKIPIAGLDKMSRANDYVKKANEILKGDRKIAAETSSESKAKDYATYAAFAACAATSGGISIFRPSITGFGVLGSMLFDCGPILAARFIEKNPVAAEIAAAASAKVKEYASQAVNLVKGALSKLGIATESADDSAKKAADSVQGGLITDQEIENSLIATFLPSQTLKAGVRGALSGNDTMTFYNKAGDFIDRDVFAKQTSQGAAREIAIAAVDNPESRIAFEKFLQPKIEAELRVQVNELVRTETSLQGMAGYYTDIDTEKMAGAVNKAVENVANDPEVVNYSIRERTLFSDQIREGTGGDAAKEKIMQQTYESMNLGELPNDELKLTLEEGQVSGITDPEYVSARNDLRKQALDKIEKKLGRVPAELRNRINSMEIPITKDEVVDGKRMMVFDRGKMAEQIDSAVKGHLAENFDGIKSLGKKYQATLDSEYKSKLASKVRVADAKKLVKSSSKGGLTTRGLLAAKNFAKEGMFALVPNLVGLKAYDATYKYFMAKAAKDPARADELKAAGLENVSTQVRGETPDGHIYNYRTYAVKLTEVAGVKQIAIKGPGSISESAKPEQVLNDCANSGIDVEGAGTLPGLMPDPDKAPKALTTKGKGSQHVQMALKYLEKSQSGDRLGSLVSAAAADDRQKFYDTTSLNLEAMIAAVGVMKSGLGTEAGTAAMFGCSIADRATADPYNNAMCAKKKIISYAQECGRDPACYYSKYDSDPPNQHSEIINVASDTSPEEFTDIYRTWESFAWQ